MTVTSPQPLDFNCIIFVQQTNWAQIQEWLQLFSYFDSQLNKLKVRLLINRVQKFKTNIDSYES
jgi:hypothetical protein